MQVASPLHSVRRRIVAGGIALAAGASLAFAGCGGAARAAGGASETASYLPAGAPVYLEASTQLDGGQWTQALALARKFPGYDRLVASVMKQLDAGPVDFTTEIRPLLGASASLGLYDVGGMGTKVRDTSVVVALALADGKDAQFIRQITTGAGAAKPLGEHNGVDMYGDADAAVAVVDGVAIIGTTQSLLERAIDAHAAGASRTMAGSDRLADALAALPDEVLAQGFVDVAALGRVAERTGGGDVAKRLADAGLGADAVIGMSISAEREGLRLKAVGMGFGAMPGQLEEFTPKLLSKVPADAIAYVGLRNAYALADGALAQASAAGPDVAKRLGQAELGLSLVGITRDDLKALASGEHAVVVTPGETTPGIAAMLEVDDGARATATFESLRTNLPKLSAGAGRAIPAFTEVQLAHGVTGWTSQLSPRAGLVLGVDGDVALLGTSVDAVKQVQAPRSTLADNAAFQNATRDMPAKVGALIWVNGPQAVGALDRLGALKSAPKDLLPNLRPITGIAAWSAMSGDTPTFEAFVTVK